MTEDAALITLVGLSGAAVMVVVYATGTRLPRFLGWRLWLVYGAVCLVTVPLPLLVYYHGLNSNVLKIAAALYIFAVLALFFGVPDKPDKGDSPGRSPS